MATSDLATEGQLSSLVAAVATAHNTNKGAIGTLASLSTTAKSNLVAAINELAGSIAGAGASINDTGTSTTSVWSSSKTNTEIGSQITTAVAGLVASAPTTLDTLNELAAALGDDANFAATTSTALGNRLRVDTAAQGLTGTQQTNALTNLGVARSSTDFAGAFNTAIA